ncbi:hypothetical protein GPJ56_004357 [Histomonas meleagridis]|uniref:uncharacterized protein n=1 Tax=Histomonas meleagridis TaxID=135588 RepID=UPI003559C5CA|nr:hypothetical protein GPJ56_004357 [Histomonas meleagridis]KAH0799998.1 hypothetical protein GO595_007110 [Histomonas meleagridis]
MSFGGFTFNWGSFNQQPKEEKPPFQMSEHMLLTELPNDLKKDFLDVYKTIQAHKEPAAKSTTYSSKNIESLVESIKKETVNELLTKLTSVANNIDHGKAELEELQSELNIAKSDLTNSSHIGDPPTPFIRRYVAKINKMAIDLENMLASAGRYLQPQQKITTNSSQVMVDLLSQEHEAIVRCSARVSQVQAKLTSVRSELESKLNVSHSQLDFSDYQFESSYQQNIQVKYKQFLNDRKRKVTKRNEESDLLGNSTKPVQTQGTGFGFGFGFGSGGFGTGSTGFGSTGSGTGSTGFGSGFGGTGSNTSTTKR